MSTPAGLPDTMRAVRLTAWGAPPELVEVPVPSPGPGEVLLAVRAAGLCHSDLHVADAAPGALPYPLPFTLGHEVAGTVVAAGPDVAPGWVGTTCAVHGIWSCGACRSCRRGRDNDCAHLTGPIGCGLGRDGGLADYVLVPAVRHLVRLDGLDPVQAAPLADAGLTALHAVGTAREVLDADAVVVVLGVGGVGHLALQVVRATSGARTVAVDTDPGARELARRLGADAVTGDLAEVAGLVRGLGAGEPGAEAVLDLVGAPATVSAGAGWLRRGGVLTVVGSAGGELAVGKGGQLAPGWTVTAPFWGRRDELPVVLDLARSGAVAVETETVGLSDVVAAYARLRAGGVRGRLVVEPGRDA
ncbi:NAD(P)-dependent alcohol dehydrogenase [Rhodococcus aerolatus]